MQNYMETYMYTSNRIVSRPTRSDEILLST